MAAELVGDLIQAALIDVLEGGGDRGMDKRALRWQETVIGDDPYPVMAEVQPVADTVEDASGAAR